MAAFDVLGDLDHPRLPREGEAVRRHGLAEDLVGDGIRPQMASAPVAGDVGQRHPVRPARVVGGQLQRLDRHRDPRFPEGLRHPPGPLREKIPLAPPVGDVVEERDDLFRGGEPLPRLAPRGKGGRGGDRVHPEVVAGVVRADDGVEVRDAVQGAEVGDRLVLRQVAPVCARSSCTGWGSRSSRPFSRRTPPGSPGPEYADESSKTVRRKFSVGAIRRWRMRSTSAGVPYSEIPSSPKITGEARNRRRTSARARSNRSRSTTGTCADRRPP